MPVFTNIITDITRDQFNTLLAKLHSNEFEGDNIAFGALESDGIPHATFTIEGESAGHDDYYALFDAFYDCEKIKHVGLRHIHAQLEGSSYDKWIKMIRERLITVDIANYAFSPDEEIEALLYNENLRHLNLCGVFNMPSFFSEISHLLMTNRLISLNLSYCWPFAHKSQNNIDFITLLDMLKYIKSLESLDLSGFDRDLVWDHLASQPKDSPLKRYFSLLQDSLSKSTSLKNLILNDLRHCKPGMLAELISENKSLTHFEYNQEVDGRERYAIETRLKINQLSQEMGAKQLLFNKIHENLTTENSRGEQVPNRQNLFLYDQNLTKMIIQYADLPSTPVGEMENRLVSAEAKLPNLMKSRKS